MTEQTDTYARKPIIFLYGPSGSGKSTAGMALAASLDLPFFDLDVEIETTSGMHIPEIFAAEGESGFRRRESRALAELAVNKERIIALGGGALTVPENRKLAERSGRVIFLDAPAETLLARLAGDSAERPLLSGDTVERMSTLLGERKAHYDSFDNRVDTTGKSPEQLAREIMVRQGMYHLRGMASAKHPGYDVRVRSGSLTDLAELLRERGLNGPIAVVTDENVAPLYLQPVIDSLANSGYTAHSITIPAGEAHKNMETVSQLWEAFSKAGIERRSTVVALGGGVVGDLTGFAAATWLRGVPWVGVPTSLLAMVDAGLGGKTGADLPQGKNLIGAFHPPRLVLADPAVLSTLPEAEMVNGLAEVIKHAVIADPGLLDLCRQPTEIDDPENLVRRAMAVKVDIIEADPYEKGRRMALNLGHTVGHGVELASGFALKHGEAVAIGMVAEARMAERIGLAEAGLAEEIASVLQRVGLPIEIPAGLDRSRVREIMMRDKKKSAGVLHFALPRVLGDVRTGIVIENWEIE